MPMNYRLSPSDWFDIISDSGARVLVAASALSGVVEGVGNWTDEACDIIWADDYEEAKEGDQRGCSYEALLAGSSPNRVRVTGIEEEDAAQMYYTSGTTGRGKGVVLSHRNVYVHAMGTIAEFRLSDADVWIHAAPLFHLADGWATWAVTWVGGVHVLVPEFRERAVLEAIEREGVTNVFPLVDDAYDMSFEDGSVDRVFAIGCLPEIPDPVRVLREAYRILNERGLVSLSELFPDPDYPRRKTEIRWAEEAGFEVDEMFGNWFIYQLNFRKKKQ